MCLLTGRHREPDASQSLRVVFIESDPSAKFLLGIRPPSGKRARTQPFAFREALIPAWKLIQSFFTWTSNAKGEQRERQALASDDDPWIPRAFAPTYTQVPSRRRRKLFRSFLTPRGTNRTNRTHGHYIIRTKKIKRKNILIQTRICVKKQINCPQYAKPLDTRVGIIHIKHKHRKPNKASGPSLYGPRNCEPKI